ncbi:TauD/TfdA family dioxygenase [Candidatus Pacearchaeota archaeon]|nr:TauD/TfdA family dioxygenase [Candidatus Pacearchaeota archaeon]
MKIQKDIFIDASNLILPDKVLKLFLILYKKYPNIRINNPLLYNALRKNIIVKWPELFKFTKEVRRKLETNNRFVVIRRFPFLQYSSYIRDFLALSFALCIGRPTPTDVHDEKIIWNITPRKVEYAPTISENSALAGLHTDSQYRKNPEKYVMLFAVRRARKGGLTTILDGKRAIYTLRKKSEGRKCVKILSSNLFPFRVPTAYTKQRSENVPEVIFAPIIAKKPLVRFRFDTLSNGFECCPKMRKPEIIWAINYFNRYVEKHPEKLIFGLNKGEILITNNHEILHGRTAFNDKKRLLLRIRIAS